MDERIIEASKCTGCAACYNACPKSCIQMKRDEYGFDSPVINLIDCIDCGICKKVCPVLNIKFKKDDTFPDAVLACAKCYEDRYIGASGGLFLSIAKSFLKNYKNSIVVGAILTPDNKVMHSICTEMESVSRFSKSKYVQSSIGYIYRCVKEYILKGYKVLFSGTPCHIYGLKSFLGSYALYSGLFCIDVVCHGVPSPIVFEKYIDWHIRNNGEIEEITFRDKKVSKKSYSAGIGIKFKNGTKFFCNNERDLYGIAFWGEIASRKSCYNCLYKTVWHASDLTLGDCWFSKELIGEDDNMGYTLAFIQSPNGKKLLGMSKDEINIYNVNSENAIKLNGGLLYRSAKENIKRDYFFRLVRDNNVSFEDCILKCFGKQRNNYIKKIVRKIPFVYKFWHTISKRVDYYNRLKRFIPDEARGKIELMR